MVIALYLLQFETTTIAIQDTDGQSQVAAVAVVDENDTNQQEALYGALAGSLDEKGLVSKLVIDDIIVGAGAQAVVGDTVSVHYVGTLQNGQQFDNSNLRGEPFSFTLGENRVIAGWEQGVLGMKVGGERILVVPPGMGYGAQTVGPIPANSTLVFVIELLAIN
jgi:FKBP-type peptidyl-prolyl cis-trans isomerase